MKRSLGIALLAMSLVTPCSAAFATASPVSTSFSASAMVAESCTLSTDNTFDFGNYDPFSSLAVAHNTVTATCVSGTNSPSLTFGPSHNTAHANAYSATGTRAMEQGNGSNYLPYD